MQIKAASENRLQIVLDMRKVLLHAHTTVDHFKASIFIQGRKVRWLVKFDAFLVCRN